MFNQSDSDEFWNVQQNWKIVSWKLHSSSGIHTIMTDEGLVIHMFVENKYPLRKEVLSQLIELKLETKEDNNMALELIRIVKKRIAGEVLNSPCFIVKSWLVQDQTVPGKDISNLLIADSLLKTIWLSIYLVVYNEELAIPEQTATGKGISNPLMAVEEDDEVKLKKLLVIKKDEDIAIDAISLATKLPVIVDYKLHKEGMLVHYELIRADRSSKRYSSMIRMLQGIDREDLEALWRIVKAKYGDTRPEYEFERVLYGNLRVMFEPYIKSDV
ncbi:hypothetical protein Tco_0919100 [Tanacetum coccineum]